MPLLSRTLLFLLLLSFSAASQTATPLLTAYQQALNHTPSIAIAEAQQNYDRQGLANARWAYLPSVSANSSVTREATSIAGNSELNSELISISLSQPIIDLPAFIRIREKSSLYEQAKLHTMFSQKELIITTASSVFGVLKAFANVNVAERQLLSLQNNFQRATLAYELGASNITDKLDAQARRDLAHANLLQKQSHLKQMEFEFTILTGNSQPAFTTLELQANAIEKVKSHLKDLNFDQLYAESLERHPELLKAKLEASRQATLLDYERKKRWPSVKASANSFYFPGLDSFDSQVTIDAAWPLINQNTNGARISQANSLRLIANEKLRLSEHQIQRAINNNLIAIQTDALKLEAFRRAVISSKSALDATREGHRLGLRSTPDLLNAEQQYFDTLSTQVSAQFDYLISALKLKFYSGALTKDDLIFLDTLFL